MKFAIYQKSDKNVKEEKERVINACASHGFVLDEENPDFVVVLGGDGSLLKAAHHYFARLEETKFVGFRCGNLGHFYDFDSDDIERVIDMIARNDYIVEEHEMIRCDLGPKYDIIHAINEVAFEKPFRTLECEIYIDGVKFEDFAGSGLLICTPLGSTGYNKSIGGAVIDHRLNAFQLTEIASIQNNVYRSLGSSFVFPKTSIIELVGDFDGGYVGFDDSRYRLMDANRISISYFPATVNLIYDQNHNSLTGIKRSFLK